MQNVRVAFLRPQYFTSPGSFRRATPPYRVQGYPQSRRCIHQLRQLPYDVDQGLGNFLSPAALRMIAVDYHQGLLTRLNEQVRGTHMEGQSVTDTVISAASHQRHALAFNYASQALNNSFFLESLQPPPPPPATNEGGMLKGNDLLVAVRTNFGSLAQLQSTFSAAAMGMINSGWVWLVCDENGYLEVVATFGAGTLLVRSRTHMRTSELPILGEPLESRYKGLSVGNKKKRGAPERSSTSIQPAYEASSGPPPTSRQNSSSSSLLTPTGRRDYSSQSVPDLPHVFSKAELTPTSQAQQLDQGPAEVMGDILTPLLCVSVHEHAWIGDYGIWGKEEYLKQFWTVVNWERVGSALKKAYQIA